MIEKFDVSREHGIPIVAMAGARLILDTGSPLSFARNGIIALGGSEHQVPVDCWAGSPAGLGALDSDQDQSGVVRDSGGGSWC